mmetsp:Transcript_162171/g.520081  ORF Transcript_162171/g.520081 Transcript_162171/m.520081 type:complete len:265 (+) Transcript_162171:298-1092(+)
MTSPVGSEPRRGRSRTGEDGADEGRPAATAKGQAAGGKRQPAEGGAPTPPTPWAPTTMPPTRRPPSCASCGVLGRPLFATWGNSCFEMFVRLTLLRIWWRRFAAQSRSPWPMSVNVSSSALAGAHRSGEPEGEAGTDWDCAPARNISSCMSQRYFCWGPSTLPGRQMRDQPMKARAGKRKCFMAYKPIRVTVLPRPALQCTAAGPGSASVTSRNLETMLGGGQLPSSKKSVSWAMPWSVKRLFSYCLLLRRMTKPTPCCLKMGT